MTTAATPTISTSSLEELFNQPSYAKPWKLIVLDDDVTTMDYVVRVFMKHFELPEEEAIMKMLEVHHEGRSVLASGTREEMEFHHLAMGHYKLRSTIEQED